MSETSEAELIEQVRESLRVADVLGLIDAAIHLNEALIALTGSGIAPQERSAADAG